MKKILVAVDFSPASVAAAQHGLELASKFDAQLLLLHVLHDPAEAPGFYASKKAGKVIRACRCPVLSVHGDKKAQAKGRRQ